MSLDELDQLLLEATSDEGTQPETKKPEPKPGKPKNGEEKKIRDTGEDLLDSRKEEKPSRTTDKGVIENKPPKREEKRESVDKDTGIDLDIDVGDSGTGVKEDTIIEEGEEEGGTEEELDEEFIIEEEDSPPLKIVVVIYGDKGTGKTTTALSFPGEIVVLSFDRKAAPIKHDIYNNDSRIHIYNAVKYMRWDTKQATEYAEKTWRYINKILDYVEKKIKPKWIVIDGTEILEQILELVMRHRHGLAPFQGIRNLNIWKERKYLLRDLHNRCLEIAKNGVIYTTYSQFEDLIVDGEIVSRKKVPKWIDIIMFEADIVLETDQIQKRFVVNVKSSKFDRVLPTGKVFDVTGKPFGFQVDWNWLGGY